MFKNPRDRVIFVHEGVEFVADMQTVQNFGIIKELLLQPNMTTTSLRVSFPKWVTKDIFSLFKEYIQINSFNGENLSDQIIQRMLWLGDHLQSDELQEKTIRDMILPRIQLKNCTLFLNEAFKKLKACEESGDIWYNLLNTCMNFTAKSLITIAVNHPADLQKVNQKIIEEILDRALKYHRRKNSATSSELLKVILQIRGFQNPIQLINNQKEVMRNKKLNCNDYIGIQQVLTHPSINWKLSNLSSIQNKETQPFKFSDYNWKLVAKMEEGQILRIYLRLEGPAQSEDPTETIVMDQRIACLYFLLSLNNSHERQEVYDLKPSYIIIEKGNTILLCEFKDRELNAYDQQRLEFTVFLNTDHVLSLAINHIFQNLEFIMKSQPDLQEFEPEDAMILLKASPPTQITQEQALTYLIHYLSKKQLSIEQQRQFIQHLQPQYLTKTFLQFCKLMPDLQPEVKHFLNQELEKQQSNPHPLQYEDKIMERSSAKRDRSASEINRQGSSRVIEVRGPMIRGQSHERAPKQVLQEMPINKLEKLKKNSSQTRVFGNSKDASEDGPGRRESTYSQQSTNSHNDRSFLVNNIQSTNDRGLSEKEQRKKAILEEINILKFLRTKDPNLIRELGEMVNNYTS